MRGTGDPEKAKSAAIFYQRWREAVAHPGYMKLKEAWLLDQQQRANSDSM